MVVNDKIGLVLSGGGFKALAQLGFLHYLFELKMPFHAVSGTSAGALIGAFLAQGFTPYQLLEICKEERIFSYSLVSFRNGGVFSANIIEKMILKHIPHNNFESLKMPLHVHVTDLTHGRELTFNQGELALAVKASCSFPLVFQPVAYQDSLLCDGGLMNNFPYENIALTCNQLIGINVNPINTLEGKMSYKQIIGRIVRIASSKLSKDAKSACTMYLEPEGIENYGMFDTSKTEELFELGYKAAVQRKAQLLEMMNQQQKMHHLLTK